MNNCVILPCKKVRKGAEGKSRQRSSISTRIIVRALVKWLNCPENGFIICVVLCLVCVGVMGFYSLLKPERLPAANVTHCFVFQVIPKRGRTNLSPETPTTWWVQTVCLCSLTTSEEGDSWPVTECERQGALCLPRSAPRPLLPQDGGKKKKKSSMKYELDTHVYCAQH